MTPTTKALQTRFREWGFPVAQRPTKQQARLLRDLIAVYERAGVLDWDDPRPLCEVCPNARPCWRGHRTARRRGPEGDGRSGPPAAPSE